METSRWISLPNTAWILTRRMWLIFGDCGMGICCTDLVRAAMVSYIWRRGRPAVEALSLGTRVDSPCLEVWQEQPEEITRRVRLTLDG